MPYVILPDIFRYVLSKFALEVYGPVSTSWGHISLCTKHADRHLAGSIPHKPQMSANEFVDTIHILCQCTHQTFVWHPDKSDCCAGRVYTNAAAVGAVAQREGIPFLLDATQSVGQMPIDVQELGCDYLVSTGRKFLRAPRGTGLLFASR